MNVRVKPSRPTYTDGHWRCLYAACRKRGFFLIRLPDEDGAYYRLERIGKRGVAVFDYGTFEEARDFLDRQPLLDADESLPAWITRNARVS